MSEETEQTDPGMYPLRESFPDNHLKMSQERIKSDNQRTIQSLAYRDVVDRRFINRDDAKKEIERRKALEYLTPFGYEFADDVLYEHAFDEDGSIYHYRLRRGESYTQEELLATLIERDNDITRLSRKLRRELAQNEEKEKLIVWGGQERDTLQAQIEELQSQVAELKAVNTLLVVDPLMPRQRPSIGNIADGDDEG